MEVINFLNYNNVSAFEDVKMLLNQNNIIVKEDGNLYLVYYKRDENSLNTLNPFQRSCNGAIFEKDTNRLVCNCYGKFLKMDNDLNENFKANYNDLVFENCIEGTLLRVYYYNGSFRVATKKCIDANKSKWGSEKSFAELFKEGINATHFKNYQFEADKVYFFILKHPENNMVFYNTNISLDLIDIFKISENHEYKEKEGVDVYGNKLIQLETYNELKEYMNNMSINHMKHQGLVVYNRHDPGIKQRLIFSLYKKAHSLINNEPSIYERFLKMRTNKELLKEYFTYFPQHEKDFHKMEDEFCRFVDDVHRLYLDTRVFKKEIVIQKNFRKLIYDLHGLYLKDRNPLMRQQVMEHMMTLNSRLFKFLYNNYKEHGLVEEDDLI